MSAGPIEISIPTGWQDTDGPYQHGLDLHESKREVVLWTSSRASPGGDGTSVSWASFLDGARWDLVIEHHGQSVLTQAIAAIKTLSAEVPGYVHGEGEGPALRWRRRLFERLLLDPSAPIDPGEEPDRTPRSYWTVQRGDTRWSVHLDETGLMLVQAEANGPQLGTGVSFDEFLVGRLWDRIVDVFGKPALDEMQRGVRQQLETRPKATDRTCGIGDCSICAELADQEHADLERGQTLPQATHRLAIVGRGPKPFSRSHTKQCPQCGTVYAYSYEYESNATGPSDEDEWLGRLTPSEGLARLAGLSEEACIALARRFDDILSDLLRLAEPEGPFQGYARRSIAAYEEKTR